MQRITRGLAKQHLKPLIFRFMTDTLRLFFALALHGDETRNLVSAHIEHLRSSADGKSARARWAKTEDLHLTIKFLGATDRNRLTELHAAASYAVSQISPFSFTICGTGAFPSIKNPRVLWLSIQEPHGWLALLQRRLEAACAEIGFSVEERPFHPHLTIARVSLPRTADACHLAATHFSTVFAPQTVTARELHLMQSDLLPTQDASPGVRYKAVERYQLSAPTPLA